MQAFRPLFCNLLLGAALAGAVPAVGLPPRPTQAQVASRFLRAILRAEYAEAYRRLAPEVRRGVSPARFTAVARPLWKTGQRHPSELELYKLGVRLGEGGTSRLFYCFAFAADSALPQPSVQFEVTFRDTASREVLGFGQPGAPARLPPKKAAHAAPGRAHFPTRRF